MNKYPSYISEKRRPAPSPKNMVENGKVAFGTFDTSIENMNFLDCVKPCGKLMPEFMKKMRYTIWEAFEINMDDISIVSAVYNMGAIGFSICVAFDKAANKVYSWQNFAPGYKCKVASNLLKNSTSELTTKKTSIKITNLFEEGSCTAECNMTNKKSGTIEYSMKAKRVSPPSIVSIPFGENKPLYSEKDFFQAEGYIKLNGKVYKSNSRTTAIVDDHKGYYPFKAHYDWLTTMGKTMIDGEEKYLGFNFTRNQSINQDDYNENLLWLEGESHPLPPLNFDKSAGNKWRIYDDHGTVEVFFELKDTFKMMLHLGLIDITYYLPFGVISGYVHDTNGKKYIVDGMTGIAEDRTQRI